MSTPLLCRVASPCVNATPVILSLFCGHLGLQFGAIMSEAAESPWDTALVCGWTYVFISLGKTRGVGLLSRGAKVCSTSADNA